MIVKRAANIIFVIGEREVVERGKLVNLYYYFIYIYTYIYIYLYIYFIYIYCFYPLLIYFLLLICFRSMVNIRWLGRPLFFSFSLCFPFSPSSSLSFVCARVTERNVR